MYLEEAEWKEWIWPSISSAGTLILFVPKKREKLRLCINYRALNRIICKDCILFSLISEILDCLLEATVFIKLDLKDAYYRIRICESDE